MKDQNENNNPVEKKNVQDGVAPVSGVEPKTEQPKKRNFKIKSVLLLVIVNILIFALSIFLIVNLPKKASELNKAKSDEQKVKESKNIDITGLEYKPTKESVDKLNGFYPEEDGVIDFIEKIEALKIENKIKNFSLVAQNAVKDKTGAFGIPFIVELEGGWDEINISLQELQKLPYLIRAVNVEVRTIDAGLVNFKYGGFLYVSDKLAKTR